MELTLSARQSWQGTPGNQQPLRGGSRTWPQKEETLPCQTLHEKRHCQTWGPWIPAPYACKGGGTRLSYYARHKSAYCTKKFMLSHILQEKKDSLCGLLLRVWSLTLKQTFYETIASKRKRNNRAARHPFKELPQYISSHRYQEGRGRGSVSE